MKKFDYIKNVLGVSRFFRPSKLDHQYQIYGPMKCDVLLFAYDQWEGENKKLVFRIMESLRISSWSVVHLEKMSSFSLQHIISRSCANKIIFFGAPFIEIIMEIWNIKNQEDLCLNQIFKQPLKSGHQLEYVITQSLEEFNDLSADKVQMRKNKLQAFEAFKVLYTK